MEKRDEIMDYMSSLFPLTEGGELRFQFSPSPYQLQTTKHDTLLVAPSQQRGDDLPTEQNKSGKQRLSETPKLVNLEMPKKRKIIHREVERQRRKQMGSLYVSLRTLLPPEYIKGKRSISDHMTEAANYIRNLHKNIEELKYKRDGLRKLCNSNNLNPEHEDPQENQPGDCVTVRHCSAGVEIVISSGLSDEMLLLSRVFRILVEEGLNVLNFASTKVNKRSIHAIQSQVCCQVPVDPSRLQQKLIDLVTSSSSISSVCEKTFPQ